ncbi:MAG: hypothetical protein AAB834_05045 [Patescibacteria group bacterium]
MLGFGDKQTHIDPTTLPIFVHSIQSAEAFSLAQKVWETNGRYVILDPANRKELMRFVFAQPTCVVWLQRDQGRSDSFELVLMWEGKEKEENVTEVYVIAALAGTTVGDDGRAKSLLSAILASPSIVPVNNNQQSMPAIPRQ